jgi:hypothetical protein
MVLLVKVYYHNKIGIRIFGTNVVLFEGNMTREDWEFLLRQTI